VRLARKYTPERLVRGEIGLVPAEKAQHDLRTFVATLDDADIPYSARMERSVTEAAELAVACARDDSTSSELSIQLDNSLRRSLAMDQNRITEFKRRLNEIQGSELSTQSVERLTKLFV